MQRFALQHISKLLFTVACSLSIQSCLDPWRRRLEAFTTDAEIIRLTRRRVAFFPTAAAERQFFVGDCDAPDCENFPWVILRISDLVGFSEKRGKIPIDKILHTLRHWPSLRCVRSNSHISKSIYSSCFCRLLSPPVHQETNLLFPDLGLLKKYPNKWKLQKFSVCVEKPDIKCNGAEKIRRRRDWSVDDIDAMETGRGSRRNSTASGSNHVILTFSINIPYDIRSYETYLTCVQNLIDSFCTIKNPLIMDLAVVKLWPL